ncbi:translation initiation factor IF-2 [Candidatus Woesearchaeota archaeon]|nr:translation initiation factor IF-2 [Candidatus Woesearchaeota archaeon]
MAAIRSPICVVLGHVDHGKTLLLDKIRGTAIQKGEAGGITQAIGASIIPLDTIKSVCGNLLKQLRMDFTIPGLLFIDTPGHEAFTNLRSRGGSIADIAVVVIDLNSGFKPQTHETIQILKQFKTPFIVAANKLDLLSGWQPKEGGLLNKIKNQYSQVQEKLDERLYEIVGKLAEYGMQSERFDRVGDFTKQVAIVPVSALTGEGVPELLMVLTGLAQRYLNECLECQVEGPAQGTVLEVKEETGLGTTVDAIIYDGQLNVNDLIVIGGIDEPITTKVRALLLPAPLAEMRDKKTKYVKVSKVVAATGVKIVAPELERVTAGMPLREATSANLEEIQKEVDEEIKEILIETEHAGIIIKADTLGSLEALSRMLKQQDIRIRKASIGKITKKDIVDAHANEDVEQRIVLGFNTQPNKEAEELATECCVDVITDVIIYKLIDNYKLWYEKRIKEKESLNLCDTTMPCKVQVMKGYVFRQRSPAIVGCDILAGRVRTGMQLMKTDEPITTVKSIQHEKKNMHIVEAGKQVALSLDKITIGRQVMEDDILYSFIPESDFRRLKDNKQLLKPEEIELLKEIAQKMREKNQFWGI